MARRGDPLGGDELLWVGMSVPAHPQAIERLVEYGKRGWLKPPPPEEGSLDVIQGKGRQGSPLEGTEKTAGKDAPAASGPFCDIHKAKQGCMISAFLPCLVFG